MVSDTFGAVHFAPRGGAGKAHPPNTPRAPIPFVFDASRLRLRLHFDFTSTSLPSLRLHFLHFDFTSTSLPSLRLHFDFTSTFVGSHADRVGGYILRE